MQITDLPTGSFELEQTAYLSLIMCSRTEFSVGKTSLKRGDILCVFQRTGSIGAARPTIEQDQADNRLTRGAADAAVHHPRSRRQGRPPHRGPFAPPAGHPGHEGRPAPARLEHPRGTPTARPAQTLRSLPYHQGIPTQSEASDHEKRQVAHFAERLSDGWPSFRPTNTPSGVIAWTWVTRFWRESSCCETRGQRRLGLGRHVRALRRACRPTPSSTSVICTPFYTKPTN